MAVEYNDYGGSQAGYFAFRWRRCPLSALQTTSKRGGEKRKFSEANIVRHLKERLKGEAFNAVHGALLAGASLTEHFARTGFQIWKQVTSDPRCDKHAAQGPKVSPTDTEDLARYSTEIYDTLPLAILESMGSENELNNLLTIGAFVEKLPLYSQHAWGSYGRRRADEDGEVACRVFCEFLEEHTKDWQFGDVQNDVRSREGVRARNRAPFQER